MKSLCIRLALLGLGVLLAACDPAPKVPKIEVGGRPDFKVSKEDEDRLEAAGCNLNGKGGVDCAANVDEMNQAEESGDSKAILTALQHRKEQIVKQQEALTALQTSIAKAKKSGKYEAVSMLMGDILSVSASTEKSSLTLDSLAADRKIMSEENFNKVFGYSCKGAYSAGDNTTQIEQLMAFAADNKAQSFKIEDKGDTGMKGNVELSEKQDAVLKMTTNPDLVAAQPYRVYVSAQGEYQVNMIGDQKLSAACHKQRVSGTGSTVITDRPVGYQRVKCTMTLLQPDENREDYKSYILHAEFSADKVHAAQEIEDLNMVTMYAEDGESQVPNQYTFAKGFNYAVKIVSDKGFIRTEIYEHATNYTIMVFKVANSTPAFRVHFETTSQNGIDVNCAVVR